MAALEEAAPTQDDEVAAMFDANLPMGAAELCSCFAFLAFSAKALLKKRYVFLFF